MKAEEAHRAVTASISTASALVLRVNDAVVLRNSSRLAVLARVAPVTYQVRAALELEVTRLLAEADNPVSKLRLGGQELKEPSSFVGSERLVQFTRVWDA